MALPYPSETDGTYFRHAAARATQDSAALQIAESSLSERRPFGARLHRDLAPLETAWRQLELEGVTTAYQRLDWVKCIGDHLVTASSGSPFYVELFDAESARTVMILPMAIERRLAGRVITWLNFGVCDYAAPIVAANLVMSEEDAILAWTAVLSVLPKADVIDIVQIPPEVGGIPNPLALLPQCRPMGLCASGVDLAGEASTLIRRVGGKNTEKELGKLRRRLDRRGEVRLVRAASEPEAMAMFEAMLDQRRQRFKKLGRFDLLAKADTRAFYLEALRRSLGKGPAQLWGLSVDGEWVATAYNLVHAGTFHGLILTTGGEEWKNCSPGLVMVGELMTRFALDGYAYFDLTIGDLPYKSGFGAKPRELRRLLFHKTPHGLAILGLMQAVAGSKAWLESHPRLFEGLRRIRRRWRQIGDRSSP